MNKDLHIKERTFMDKLRRLSKPIIHLVIVGVATLSLHLPTAHAAIVGTEAVVNAQQAAQDRAHVQEMLGRDTIKQQFLRAGVDPSQVSARVDALSDSEVHQLVVKIDQVPAGGPQGAASEFTRCLCVHAIRFFAFTASGPKRSAGKSATSIR